MEKRSKAAQGLPV